MTTDAPDFKDSFDRFDRVVARSTSMREFVLSLNQCHAFDDELHCNSVGAINWSVTKDMVKHKGIDYLHEMAARESERLAYLRQRPQDVRHWHDSFENSPFSWMVQQLNALNLLREFGVEVKHAGIKNLLNRDELAALLHQAVAKDESARTSLAEPVDQSRITQATARLVDAYAEGFDTAEYCRITAETLRKADGNPREPAADTAVRTTLVRVLDSVARRIESEAQSVGEPSP